MLLSLPPVHTLCPLLLSPFLFLTLGPHIFLCSTEGPPLASFSAYCCRDDSSLVEILSYHAPAWIVLPALRLLKQVLWLGILVIWHFYVLPLAVWLPFIVDFGCVWTCWVVHLSAFRLSPGVSPLLCLPDRSLVYPSTFSLDMRSWTLPWHSK